MAWLLMIGVVLVALLLGGLKIADYLWSRGQHSMPWADNEPSAPNRIYSSEDP